MPYLPSAPPSYDPSTGLNTGDLGFFSLPGTIEGANPHPYGNSFNQNAADLGLSQDFNPFTQGFFITGPDGKLTFRPVTPRKIVYGSRDNLGPIPGGGQATQTINGQTVNVGANNYAAGTSAPKAQPFQASYAGPTSTQTVTNPNPFQGFLFGNNGSAGRIGGSVQDGRFWSNQPGLNSTQPGLGVLQPWNPSVGALQQYRSQP